MEMLNMLKHNLFLRSFFLDSFLFVCVFFHSLVTVTQQNENSNENSLTIKSTQKHKMN